jgi:hypothetical protein
MNIISRRDSGLGDMLSNLTHCIWLAENISAFLHVDWRYTQYHDSKNKNLNFFPEFFELKADFNVQDIEKLKMGNVILPYGLKQLSHRNDRTAVEPQVFETFGITGKVPRFDTLITTRSLDFLPLSMQFEFLKLIDIQQNIKKECELYLSNIRKPDRKIYGVHIRHGNGELYVPGGEAEQKLFDLYNKSINDIREKEGVVDFFLFTDSYSAIDWFEANIGECFRNMNVRYPKKIGLPMHENRDTTIFGYDILKWSVQDFYYMSQLDGLICDSWSNFTRWSRAHGKVITSENTKIINPPRLKISVSKPLND